MTLKLINLCYERQGRQVLQSIHLHLTPGQIYGIIGPNGSGKSTLLKTLAGIWTPTEGEIKWQGISLHQQNRRFMSQTVTLVPQQPSPPFDFTVWEIVKMGRYAHGFSPQNQEIIEHALHQTNSWQLKDRLVSTLSGGEKQRVYMARALATQAPVLALDEPSSCLDLHHQWEMWHLLRQLAKQNRLILIALHDLKAARHFCDELVVLFQGRCVGTGSYANVMTPALLHQVFSLDSEKQHYFNAS